MSLKYEKFSESLLKWFEQYGRKDLPWQHPKSAYRVWISEVMLQQTQVKTVIPYFTRFIERFPNVQTLSLASEDEVLKYWAGLGYYRRARALHQTAQIITNQLNQEFPQKLDELCKLPGIGMSTAAAIASLAFNQPTAILDGNVKRVLSRYFLIAGDSTKSQTERQLWNIAHQCMPLSHCAEYTQAIMDLGATCCTPKHPQCHMCPLNHSCTAFLKQVVDEYPMKKKRASLPNKQHRFLLLYDQEGLLYFKKRPPTGIWGGLWSLIELEMDQCVKNYLETQYQLQVEHEQELMRLKHTFTHFHLHMHVVAVRCQTMTTSIAEKNREGWFTTNEIEDLGLPQPIKKVLKEGLPMFLKID